MRAALKEGAEMTVPGAAELHLIDLQPPMLARAVLLPAVQPDDEFDSDATDALRAQALQILIDNGLFNGQDSLNAALIAATQCGRGLAVMQCLLKAGGDAMCCDTDAHSLLHFVRCRDVAAMLIAAGVDATAVGAEGVTPLHALAASSLTQQGLVKLLADAGANVDATNDAGRTPLMYAARCGMDPNAYSFVKELLRAGADPTIEDNIGGLARYYAMAAFDERKQEGAMDILESMSGMATVCTLELAERWRRRRHMLLAIRGRQ